MKLDPMYYTFNSIDGYNRNLNCVLSEREDGKTTQFHVVKAKPAFLINKRPTLVFRRQAVDITEAYISSLSEIQSKFDEDGRSWDFKYKRGSIKDGVVDLCLNGDVMYRIIALSMPLQRLKSLFLKNPQYVLFDEFIVNTRLGERYLKNEGFRIKEAYNTFYREAETPPKMYFLGNPYSRYCPVFSEFGIRSEDVVPGKITAGPNWAVEYHRISEALKSHILAKNPLYKFEDSYTRYALHGEAINDQNILVVPECPQGFSLQFVFTVEGKSLGVFEANDWSAFPSYWVGEIDSYSKRRTAYCFEFQDLVEHSVLFSMTERNRLARFRAAVRSRGVAFQSLECDYRIEDIYTAL